MASLSAWCRGSKKSVQQGRNGRGETTPPSNYMMLDSIIRFAAKKFVNFKLLKRFC